MFVVRCVNKHFFDFDSQQFCPECARLGMVYDIERLPECPACRKPILFYDSKYRVVCDDCGEATLTHCICGNRVVNFCTECGTILPGADLGFVSQINRFPSSPNPVESPFSEESNGFDFVDEDKTESGYPENTPVFEDEAYSEWEEDDVTESDIPGETFPIFDAPNEAEYGDDQKTESEYPQNTPVSEYLPENDDSDEGLKGELEAEIQKITEDDDDRTMGFYEAIKAKKRNPCENKHLNPVVGWLVCVAGEHLGESFNIYSGHNSIGRNSTNKIVLNKDRAVSGENHAYILFEPEKKVTHIKPGSGTSFVYLNDEAVLEVVKIKPYEKIRLGGTVLMYVPLCGDNFDWTEYVSKE